MSTNLIPAINTQSFDLKPLDRFFEASCGTATKAVDYTKEKTREYDAFDNSHDTSGLTRRSLIKGLGAGLASTLAQQVTPVAVSFAKSNSYWDPYLLYDIELLLQQNVNLSNLYASLPEEVLARNFTDKEAENFTPFGKGIPNKNGKLVKKIVGTHVAGEPFVNKVASLNLKYLDFSYHQKKENLEGFNQSHRNDSSHPAVIIRRKEIERKTEALYLAMSMLMNLLGIQTQRIKLTKRDPYKAKAQRDKLVKIIDDINNELKIQGIKKRIKYDSNGGLLNPEQWDIENLDKSKPEYFGLVNIDLGEIGKAIKAFDEAYAYHKNLGGF